jgi:AAA15 family ATPase/GTPase
MSFKTIKLRQWQQFENVQIELHDRLTILTGANGSGKTTILNLFARHVGWNLPSLSTPKDVKKNGVFRFLSRFFQGEDRSDDTQIGTITYENGDEALLVVPNTENVQYQIQVQNQQNVDCFFIPSHRAVYRYQQLGNIPTTKKDKKSAFKEVSNISLNRYQGGGGESASFVMKNTLIGWLIGGYGVKNRQNKMVMAEDQEQIEAFEGFEKVLKKVLPPSLGFEEVEVRKMEIVFVCNGGEDEFILENASGGISALIDIAWQIYMYSTNEKSSFTVIIDEIENHLHPTMQRTLLQSLLDAFPSVKFIVSTHSPLIVGSVRDSSVFCLLYNNMKKIESVELDFLGAAKSATEILDEVLGVSFTMPVWVENELSRIVQIYRQKSLTKQDFANLRKDLAAIGLERLVPQAIEEIVDGAS